MCRTYASRPDEGSMPDREPSMHDEGGLALQELARIVHRRIRHAG